MKNFWKKSVLFLIAAILFFCTAFIGNGITVQAGGAKAKQAIKAYQKFLGQDKIKWSNISYKKERFKFILADVNADGVPELFLQNTAGVSHYEGYEAVFYYYKKKVVEALRDDAIKVCYPQNGIVGIFHYGMGGSVSYVKIPNNGKAKIIGDAYELDDPVYSPSYFWNGKKVSKSSFNRALKKAAGKKKVKIKSGQWISNTAENRKKMSKWKK